ncbi:hypothetical protein NDU88_006201 [Pleurodeles waltl]|uniref:Uncharacterized protein n=1 Tax=Pleurodeles waltl TaxID=8319 RepID=A0AAV7X004_PLEWA|nr:hypothetical protein NDU88_006201 [Pleurodeles waltl]
MRARNGSPNGLRSRPHRRCSASREACAQLKFKEAQVPPPAAGLARPTKRARNGSPKGLRSRPQPQG